MFQYVKWKNWNKLDVERNNAERTIKVLEKQALSLTYTYL